jgi:hypothetical protein
MANELIQKSHAFRVSIKMLEQNLQYSVKRMGEELEATIPFEDLTDNLKRTSQGTPFLFFLGMIFFLFFCFTTAKDSRLHFPQLGVLLLILSPVCVFICFTVEKVKLLSLQGVKYNVYVLNNAEGRAFIESIRKQRKAYLREAYGKIRWENDPAKEIDRLRFLCSQGIISDEEFRQLKEDLFTK